MADLTSSQGSTPVEVINETSGNTLGVESSGCAKVSTRLFPGSDSTKLYSASFDVNLATSGVQANVLLLRNPSGSSKTVRVIEIGTDVSNTVSSAVYYRLYVAPTVTGVGTSQTVTSLAVGGGAASASTLAYSSPTTSSVGARIDSWYSTGGASGQGYATDLDGMLTLAANTDLLVTGTPDGTNRNTLITIWWLEE